MIKGFCRQHYVAKEMQKEIAIILQHKIKDPRIHTMITISGVEVSRDLAYAKIYVTLLHDEDKDLIKNTIDILQKASSYVRTLLSKSICLRTIPKLTFFYDNSLIEGIKICNLINNTIKCHKNCCVNFNSNNERSFS